MSTKSTNTHGLTRRATAVSKTQTHYPSLSQLTGKIGEKATLTDPGNSHTTDHIVSVEYAAYMMVPPTTNTMRYHGLSQFIQMNNQGSKQKMDIFQRVKQ